jgi:hypothetical protein
MNCAKFRTPSPTLINFVCQVYGTCTLHPKSKLSLLLRAPLSRPSEEHDLSIFLAKLAEEAERHQGWLRNVSVTGEVIASSSFLHKM